MTNELAWSAEFNIGVERIDSAHQKLFSIVRRIMKMIDESENNQWACMEGIKYFKNYALQHFAEEEDYMRSIGYKGYDMHKKLHDNLRDKTLPILEQNLENSDYSTESVEQFLGVCISWLTGHIMIEDKAITGKISSKWDFNQLDSVNESLEKALIQVMREVYGLKSHIFSDHYAGEGFGRTINYLLYYKTPEDKHVWVVMSMEEKLIFGTIGKVLGLEVKKIDTAILSATKLLAQQILRRIGAYFGHDEGTYRLRKDALISADAMKRLFEKRNPHYSLLFDTEVGCFAFCANEQ